MSYLENIQKDNEYIYKLLFPYLEKIYKDYRYIIKSEMMLQEIALKEISLSRTEFDGEGDYVEYVLGKVKDTIDSYVDIELNDQDNCYNIINEFINKQLNGRIGYKKSLENFKLLNALFENHDFSPDPDMITKLLTENKLFSDMTAIVVNKNLKAIQNGDFMLENDTILAAVDRYCMLMGIEIKEETFDDNITAGNLDEGVKQLLRDIAGYPLLKADEEKELALKIKAGDEEAKERFTYSNIRLVLSIANKYRGRGLAYSDLVQEGCIGLMTAVDRFDPNKNFKFSTYATWWIKRACIFGYRTKGRVVKIPYNKHDDISKYRYRFLVLKDKLDRDPTIEEMAKDLGITHKKALELYNLQIAPVSLNMQIGEEGDTIELGDVLPSPVDSFKKIYNDDLHNALMKVLEQSGLSEKQIDILLKRNGFVDGKVQTLETIATPHNNSRERIRQIEKKSYEKIRLRNKTKELLVYTENPKKAEEFIDKFREDYINDKNNNKSVRKRHKTIYELFPKYTKEMVDKAIRSLSEEEQEILRNKFGDDFSIPPDIDYLAKEEAKKYRNEIVPKMQTSLSIERRRLLKGKMVDQKQEELVEEQEVKEKPKRVRLSPFLRELNKINKQQAQKAKVKKLIKENDSNQ